MEELFDYIFHFNHYRNCWNCFRREDSVDYFNGNLEGTDKLMRSEDINTIIKYITTIKDNYDEGVQ